MSVDENGEPVKYDDYSLQIMIFDMVKGMEHVTKKLKMPPYDKNLKATVIQCNMSDEMKKNAIKLARAAFAKQIEDQAVVGILITTFQELYG